MFTIYTKSHPKGMSEETIGYMVAWWELPLVIINENFNIKSIVKE